MANARFIKDIEGWRGDARLYHVEPPLDGYDYVIVSAVPSWFDTMRPETYIFPANENGEEINMSELSGSFKGDMDHARALRGAGYEVTE